MRASQRVQVVRRLRVAVHAGRVERCYDRCALHRIGDRDDVLNVQRVRIQRDRARAVRTDARTPSEYDVDFSGSSCFAPNAAADRIGRTELPRSARLQHAAAVVGERAGVAGGLLTELRDAGRMEAAAHRAAKRDTPE